MSGVSVARQRLGASWRAAVWPGRVLHAALRVALVTLIAAVIGTGGLAWRLAQGPLDVAWLARRIEARALPPDAPAHLSIGGASIAWNGFQEGADGGLEIRLHRLRLIDPAQAPIARLDEVDATLSLLRLFELHVVPRRVALSGLRLRAVRSAAGDVTLDLGGLDDTTAGDHPGASLNDILGQLRQPASSDRDPAGGLAALAQLQRATVHDARVQIEDQSSGKTLRATLADLDLRRQGRGGIKGSAGGTVTLGDASATLRLIADLAPGGGTHLEATLAPTQIGPIAQTSEALASVAAVDAAIQARATLDLSSALTPTAAELHLASGGGSVSAAGATVNFEKIRLDLAGSWDGVSWRPGAIAVQRAQVVLPSSHGGWSTTVGVTGAAHRAAGKIDAAFDLSLDHADFADLADLWPEVWGGHTRPWLVQNVTAGTARDGAFHVKLAAPEDKPTQIELLEAGGTMQGQDVTIHWLRPVPPIEHAEAQLRVLGPDAVDIAVPTASQGPIALKDGLIHFTGLSTKDQFMSLTTGVQGPVADAVQLLRHPRLKLLDKHPLPIKAAGGTVVAKLAVDMPMKKEIQAEQVHTAAQGRLSNLRLAGLVAGRDIDHGDIDFDVNQDGMKASGPATVANIVGMVDVTMDFRGGPPSQVLLSAALTGHATASQMTAAGIDPGGLITAGYAGLNTVYISQRDGTSHVEVKADLTAAGLSLGGWKKPAGPIATAAALIVLQNDKLAGIEHIEAKGPSMRIIGRAELVGGRPLLLRLEHIMLGPTQATGEILFPARPADPIRVRLSGPSLDLSNELASKPSRAAEGEANWIADLHFDRVDLGKGRTLSGVIAHAEDDGHRLRALEATAMAPRIQVAIAPQGNGRRVAIRAADAGALIHILDAGDNVTGGSLALDGTYDDSVPSAPFTGTLDMSEFDVHHAVAIGKLLQAVTIYGVFDAMRGDGVHFSRLILPFRYDRQQLHLGETRAFSASLGLTATGWVDFGRKIMDIRGTIVPAYAVNSALGHLPLLGRLFSPEKGSGLVAVNYAVTGSSSDPNISVNPLSALTPGFMRRLFNIFS